MKSQITKLTTILGMSSICSVPLAALAGLFKPENAIMLAVALMAGPGAIVTSILLDGTAKQRMFTALLAGLIATCLVIFAAGAGPKLLNFVNLNIIKVFGGISVGAIALMIAGIKLPEKLPLVVITLGVVAGMVWR